MPRRPLGRHLVACVASLGLLAAVATAGIAGPADAATPTPPPWVTGQLQPGDWIAYTLSTTNPPVFQRNPTTQWGPVTLTRQGNAPTSVLASELGGPNNQPGWPSGWSSSGVTLTRADQFCDLAAPSCQYYVTSGAGQPFFFGSAVAPAGGSPHDLTGFDQGTLQLAPPPALVAAFTSPQGGTLPSSGSFTFDGSSSRDGLPGALSYRWTLLSANGQTLTQDGPQPTYTPPASVFSQSGQYCVTLVVTASDGSTAKQGPSCFVVIANPTPAPQPPAATPPAQPAPSPPAGGGSPAAAPAAAAPLSFAKPLPNFAVPVPGAVQQVTVIWLWRPDWFQSTPSGVGKTAKTAGQPSAANRASVSVDRSARSSPSAAPWLAGLGAFGIFGAGWLAFQRRRVRSSLLD